MKCEDCCVCLQGVRYFDETGQLNNFMQYMNKLKLVSNYILILAVQFFKVILKKKQ